MKKKMILVLLGGLFLLSGCGSNKDMSNDNKDNNEVSNSGTLNCTKIEYDDDGYKNTDTYVIKYKDNIVTNVTATNVSETDPDSIDFTLSFGTLFTEALNKVDGINVKYSKLSDNELESVIDIDYSKVDLEKVRETFGDAFDDSQESLYTRNVSLDIFKADALDGFTCK